MVAGEQAQRRRGNHIYAQQRQADARHPRRADLGTLDLLTFLALPLRALRTLIVATVRTRDPRLTDRSGLPRARPLLRGVMDSQLRIPLDTWAPPPTSGCTTT